MGDGDGLGDGGRELPIPDQAIKVHHRDGTGQSHMRGNGSWSSSSALLLGLAFHYFIFESGLNLNLSCQ